MHYRQRTWLCGGAATVKVWLGAVVYSSALQRIFT